MKYNFAHLNLVLGWLWIALGFVSGMLLGFRFNDEHWLGGYTSWRRRLYRLGHVSFFGLGLLNLVFFLTTRELNAASEAIGVASIGFALGAVAMPICCVIAAHQPNCKPIFSVPVLSLITGVLVTLWILL